ncbi:iron ABC transporter permease [Ferrimonas sp. SCSIO 43195]|uniref:FecCD family ABC transporter permease n=1 Tax=Ferrimonas sp. SCSIO 43195 TaxID=2822844 RepID=UPI0020751073|nr:iron ABC transporter permease [Ferrimonas sp. SCSIO 43195]USD39096.1 iron ABC transporter permease [Ferrimonas sp. SCSIO 43195]
MSTGTGVHCLWLVLGLLLVSLWALTQGAVSVPVAQAWEAVWSGSGDPLIRVVIVEMRLPRVLLAALVGAALSVAGALTQTLVRNPLADPYLLGIANGAALAAVTGLTLAWSLPTPVLATLGALAAFVMVMSVASYGRLSLSPYALILCGVAISALGSSLTTLMMLLGDDRALGQILRWLMGSMAGADLERSLPLLVALPLAMIWLRWRTVKLDLMLLGQDKARSLGLHPLFERRAVAVVILVLTALSVAAAGAVSFVGLLVPHLARMWVGGLHRRWLPVVALLGAMVTVGVDGLCRLLLAPEELPLSVPMAVLTVPLILLLIRRQADAGA